MVIMGFDFKSLKDEIMNSSSSPSLSQKKKKTWGGHFRSSSLFFLENPFRERNFSLKIHKIQPSAVFGMRRKNVLRGAGYAWTPGLGVSSNSLR